MPNYLFLEVVNLKSLQTSKVAFKIIVLNTSSQTFRLEQQVTKLRCADSTTEEWKAGPIGTCHLFWETVQHGTKEMWQHEALNNKQVNVYCQGCMEYIWTQRGQTIIRRKTQPSFVPYSCSVSQNKRQDKQICKYLRKYFFLMSGELSLIVPIRRSQLLDETVWPTLHRWYIF